MDSYWCGDIWKEHLSFTLVSVLLWSGIYSGSCTGTQVTNGAPSGLSLGGIPEGINKINTSTCSPVQAHASTIYRSLFENKSKCEHLESNNFFFKPTKSHNLPCTETTLLFLPYHTINIGLNHRILSINICLTHKT